MKKYRIKAFWIEAEVPTSSKVLGDVYSTEALVPKKAHEWFDIWLSGLSEDQEWKDRTWVRYEEVED